MAKRKTPRHTANCTGDERILPDQPPPRSWTEQVAWTAEHLRRNYLRRLVESFTGNYHTAEQSRDIFAEVQRYRWVACEKARQDLYEQFCTEENRVKMAGQDWVKAGHYTHWRNKNHVGK